MENEVALQVLALTLLKERFGHDPDARLVVADIPTNLPIDVPIPPQTRILGTWGSPDRAQIFLETTLDASTVEAFYREQFTEQGLRELDLSHPVFFPSPLGPEMQQDLGLSAREVEALEGTDWARLTFRIGDDGPVVTVQAQEGQESPEPTSIEIEIGADPVDWGFDEEATDRRGMLDQIHRLLPVLTPPDGIQTWGGGENWSSDDAHVQASMVAELDTQAVADHFNPQIASLGWSEIASGVAGPVAWSQWERREEDIGEVELLWFALRLATRPTEYVLQLHGMKRDPRRPWSRNGGVSTHIIGMKSTGDADPQ